MFRVAGYNNRRAITLKLKLKKTVNTVFSRLKRSASVRLANLFLFFPSAFAWFENRLQEAIRTCLCVRVLQYNIQWKRFLHKHHNLCMTEI